MVVCIPVPRFAGRQDNGVIQQELARIIVEQLEWKVETGAGIERSNPQYVYNLCKYAILLRTSLGPGVVKSQ
jgi:hypothetical protein